MTIQFNTDKNIEGNDKLTAALTVQVSEGLKRFSSHITRLEIHLSDENGQKQGQGDKKCLIEARVERMQPIAVTNFADTVEQAVTGAVTKLETSLETRIGRLKSY